MNIGIYQPYEEAVISAFTGMSALMASISLSVGIISIVSMWMIFEKASEPGWKCLIPIYNLFIFFKITWLNGWYFLLMFIPLVNMVVGIVTAVKLAKVFDKDGWFAVGLIFLGPLFTFILAFDKSRYIGGYGNFHF